MPEITKREHEAVMREVYDLRVFVVGGGFQYVKMFFDAGFRGAKNVQDAHIVCFTGGEDVNPELYGEKPLKGTHFSRDRDGVEAYYYGEALSAGKPMVGICRGGQFLNVMNEGKLWQDVNNHGVYQGHAVTDIRTGEVKEGMNILRSLYDIAKNDKRTDCPLSELRVGLKCGGSDGFSGITANPLVGEFSDFLVAQGGTSILTEA